MKRTMEEAAAEAFNNMFHKVRAEVSMDWWQTVWRLGVQWARQNPVEVGEDQAMAGGRWVNADDIERMTGELYALATGQPAAPVKMVDAYQTIRAALLQRSGKITLG